MCELFLPFAEHSFVLNINLNLLRLQALRYQHGTIHTVWKMMRKNGAP